MKKTMLILLCIVIFLLGCIRIAARFDYHGLLLAYNYGVNVGDLPTKTNFGLDQYKNGSIIEYNGYCIFQNRFGKVALTKIDYGGTYKMEPVGAFLPKLKTHFSMLSLWEGMSVAQLINTVGAPNCSSGSGIHVLTYVTADGYRYDIYYAERDAGMTYYNIYDANDELVDKVVFQWVIRLGYLGVAAILSSVLVCLLVIPKRIEKRKAERLQKQEG